MTPDFDKMSKAELRAYVLTHTNDQEAFYKLVDRFTSDSTTREWHPFPKSLDDVAKVSELIQEQIKKLETDEQG